MKTEKEFSEHFERVYQAHHPESGETSELAQISKNYWSDLTSHLSFYFTHESRLQITEKSAALLARNSYEKNLNEAWKDVIRDFNQNQYWDFKSVSQKPKKVQTEEQKIFWKLFRYAWAFFQSMVILKIAVYYFGLESANHPDQTSSMWVWLFFSLSVSSLVFFAYRNRHDKN